MEEKGSSRSAWPKKPPPRPAKSGGRARAGAGPGLNFKFQSKKVTPRMLENFTRLLSSLLAAGVPLSRALVILCKEASNPVAQAKWKAFYDSVVDGVTLADSMADACPKLFPASMWRWCRRGRRAGFWTWCWRRSPISRCGKGI